MTTTSPTGRRRPASSGRSPSVALAAGSEKPNVLPDADLALQPHPATEQLDDPARQGEPEPGALLARAAAAALLEGLEDPLPVRLGHADAGVGHGDLDLRRRRASARTTTDPPSPVNLTALVIRLSTTCLSRSSSDVRPSDVVGDLDAQVDRRASAARSRSIAAASSSSATQVERRVLQLHPAGLDLREVEDLVEQLQQVLARAVDVAEVLLLPLVDVAEHPLEQHLGEPEHRVQRRPQLVGHAGQELRLVPAGQLELDALLLELPEELGVEQSASADWLANVSSRSSGLLGEVRRSACGGRSSDPTIWPSRSIGTATSERQPSSCRIWRWGSSVDLAQVRRRRSVGAPARRARRASRRGRCGSTAAVRRRSALGPVDAAHQEAAVPLGVLHDRAAVGLRRARRRAWRWWRARGRRRGSS